MVKVAYLGPEGTYTEEAARSYFGQDAIYVPCSSISAAFDTAEADAGTVCVIPLENSTEGTVSITVDRLVGTPLVASAEIMLPIHHQLITRAQSLADITEVVAHAQSLAQCNGWLEANVPHATRTAAVSNAYAVKEVSEAADKTRAAIAGRRAADIYSLPILEEDIEDLQHNTTRFFVMGHTPATPTGNDKTTFVCSVPDTAGSLYELLGILKRYNLNMTKLESRPAANGRWEYLFYIDIEGHSADENMKQAITEMESHATFFKIVGSYPMYT